MQEPPEAVELLARVEPNQVLAITRRDAERAVPATAELRCRDGLLVPIAEARDALPREREAGRCLAPLGGANVQLALIEDEAAGARADRALVRVLVEDKHCVTIASGEAEGAPDGFGARRRPRLERERLRRCGWRRRYRVVGR